MKCFQMFEPLVTEYFMDKTDKFRNNNEIKRKINRSVKILSENPYGNSESLGGNHKGKRKHVRGNLRLIFAICKECRTNKYTDVFNCLDCAKTPDESLMFFDVDYRGQVYKKK